MVKMASGKDHRRALNADDVCTTRPSKHSPHSGCFFLKLWKHLKRFTEIQSCTIRTNNLVRGFHPHVLHSTLKVIQHNCNSWCNVCKQRTPYRTRDTARLPWVNRVTSFPSLIPFLGENWDPWDP